MKYIKKFEEMHFGTETGPEDGNFQHQQADGVPRSPQITSTEIDSESDNNGDAITNIGELVEGDVIIYQGSKAIVRESGEFAVRCESNGKEFLINQGQLDQYGVKVVARRYH